MTYATIERYRAFTIPRVPSSGNPAGVVLGADFLSDADMQDIATQLGFSESAFLSDVAPGSARIRYFTPRAEIAFCGHATIASGAALARAGATGVVRLRTNAGEVLVEASAHRAVLTAVETSVEPLDETTLDELLHALRLTRADLDPRLPPALVRGGNPHPVVPVTADALARLDHDPDEVLRIQDERGWDGTVPVVHRLSRTLFRSRNPFPRGGIREDPATGSAAADLGAYLRWGGHIATPATITVEQGGETGRPCLLSVEVPSRGRVRVSGTVARLDSE